MSTGSTPSTGDLVQSWLKGGGSEGTPDASGRSQATDESEFVTAQESSMDDILSGSDGNGEDTPTDSQAQEPASSKAKPETSGTKEVVTISDDKGRRKIEVDFSNKEQVKKYVQMAYGARKWQAERDQARQESTGLKSQLTEMKSNWDALEGAFRKSGVEGVIDLLEGRPGAYKTHIQKQVDRNEFIRRASPEELEALESREKADYASKELDRIRKENEEFRKKMTEEKETAEMRSLESKVHPAFDKYRFADKLGDSTDEAMFDEMLWNSALKRLEPYEEQGVAISSELIEREFRTVAQSIRKRIGLQADRKASKVIEQKKQEATENVQAKVMSGYKTGGKAKEARDLIDNRNLTGLLKNWGKYGSLFNK